MGVVNPTPKEPTMLTATRKPRQPKPMTCCVVSRPAACCELLPFGQAGEVEINGGTYGLELISELGSGGEVTLYGYRLTKDDGVSYDLPLALDGCECMGHLQWSVACKHIKALR